MLKRMRPLIMRIDPVCGCYIMYNVKVTPLNVVQCGLRTQKRLKAHAHSEGHLIHMLGGEV